MLDFCSSTSVFFVRVVQPLVVVVHCDREHPLCHLLADDVVVENLADLLRRRHAVRRLDEIALRLLADDVHAEFDALVADEHRRPRDQLAHLVLALAAERAIEGVLCVAAARLAHATPPAFATSFLRHQPSLPEHAGEARSLGHAPPGKHKPKGAPLHGNARAGHEAFISATSRCVDDLVDLAPGLRLLGRSCSGHARARPRPPRSAGPSARRRSRSAAS